LGELSKAIVQPSTSLDQFELFLQTNIFAEAECHVIAARLREYTIKSSEYSFLLRICSACIGNLSLSDALAKEFFMMANDYLTGVADANDQSVPELFGHVVAARWPSGKGKALESVNPVLYVVMGVVLSWVRIMSEYGKSEETTSSEAEKQENEQFEDGVNDDLSSNTITSQLGELQIRYDEEIIEKAKEEKEEEDEPIDEKTVALAALGICTVCNISQRNFWLNFMETFDAVFVATKHLLVNPGAARLPKTVRESLLQLYISLYKWSSPGQPKRSSAATQT